MDHEDVALSSNWANVMTEPCDICAVIGVRGRGEFIPVVVRSLQASAVNYNLGVVIVEHAHELQHEALCVSLGVMYIGIPCGKEEPYNRSLAFNIGVLFGPKSDYVLTHDVDCVVQTSFFDNLIKNLSNHDALAVQSFTKRRVLYCDQRLSNEIILGRVRADGLNENSVGIYTCPGQASGGSIFLTRDLFFSVGGYDPELFTGYAPEDQFFWYKMSMFTEVASADNPVTEIFHLHHQFMGNTNPRLKEMIDINDEFCTLRYTDKAEIIQYKQQLIKAWR